MKILLIQGANMVALGKRDPKYYGTITREELDRHLIEQHPDDEIDIRYTNIEGEAINWIHEADAGDAEGLVMNPAGFLHAGYALRDCLEIVSLPYIEVHMSNIDQRGFHSVTAPAASGMIAGLGVQSYMLAIQAVKRLAAGGD
ncbi:MAG: type II 3-dehydroquinate dehydratase [Pseudomonadota bacterium]